MPELDDHARSEHDDRISSALSGLYAQAPVALPLPYETVRRRGAGRRRRRRAAVLGVAAVVCAVGLGVALPGRQQGAVVPATTWPAPVPAPALPPPPSASATPSRAVAGYVDLTAHTVRVESGTTTLRTLPATAGRPDFPTPTGVMKVAEKHASLHVSSSGPRLEPSGEGEYDLTLLWCVRLVAEDGRWAFVCGMQWYGSDTFGHQNRTAGAVGLSTEDARWFFDQVQVGDPVSVVDPGSGHAG